MKILDCTLRDGGYYTNWDFDDKTVDAYFANWEGPKHPIFKKSIDMSQYSGNQKWLMWCLERYLNIIEN